jgi:mannose/fructose/N-acetylgalactosamine-specific phosphotransferase system component IIB
LLLDYIKIQMDRRKKWDQKRIKAAIDAMKNEKMGGYKAFRICNIPHATQQCYVKDRQKGSSETIKQTG